MIHGFVLMCVTKAKWSLARSPLCWFEDGGRPTGAIQVITLSCCGFPWWTVLWQFYMCVIGSLRLRFWAIFLFMGVVNKYAKLY